MERNLNLPSPTTHGEVYLREILMELRDLNDNLRAPTAADPRVVTAIPELVRVKEAPQEQKKGKR